MSQDRDYIPASQSSYRCLLFRTVLSLYNTLFCVYCRRPGAGQSPGIPDRPSIPARPQQTSCCVLAGGQCRSIQQMQQLLASTVPCAIDTQSMAVFAIDLSYPVVGRQSCCTPSFQLRLHMLSLSLQVPSCNLSCTVRQDCSSLTSASRSRIKISAIHSFVFYVACREVKQSYRLS